MYILSHSPLSLYYHNWWFCFFWKHPLDKVDKIISLLYSLCSFYDQVTLQRKNMTWPLYFFLILITHYSKLAKQPTSLERALQCYYLMNTAEKNTGSVTDSQHQKDHRMIEKFKLEGTKRSSSPITLQWVGTSSARSGSSQPHPNWPWMFPGMNHLLLLWETCPSVSSA